MGSLPARSLRQSGAAIASVVDMKYCNVVCITGAIRHYVRILCVLVFTTCVLFSVRPSSALETVAAPPVSNCASQDKQIANIQDKLNSIAADNLELRKQVDAKTLRVIELEKALGESAKKIGDDEAKLGEAQHELLNKDGVLKQLQDDLGVTKKAKQDAESQIANLGAERAMLKNQVAELAVDARQNLLAGNDAFRAWQKEKVEASNALVALDAAVKKKEVIVEQAAAKEKALKEESAAAEKAKTSAVADRDNARDALNKTQAELRKVREQAEVLIVRFTAVSALLLFVGMVATIFLAHRQAQSRSLGASIIQNSIAADVRDDLVAHLVAARYLRWLIIGAGVLAAVAAMLGPGFFLYVEACAQGTDPSDVTAVLDSIYWRMLLGFVAPLGALLAIYKTVHEKGKDALALCSMLGVETGAKG